MPSREEFNERTPGGGETGNGNEREIPPAVMIFAFFGWAFDGRFLGGRSFDTADECEIQREQDRARYPRVQFSLCAMLWAERETL